VGGERVLRRLQVTALGVCLVGEHWAGQVLVTFCCLAPAPGGGGGESWPLPRHVCWGLDVSAAAAAELGGGRDDAHGGAHRVAQTSVGTDSEWDKEVVDDKKGSVSNAMLTLVGRAAAPVDEGSAMGDGRWP
jgi:hypothetical protein